MHSTPLHDRLFSRVLPSAAALLLAAATTLAQDAPLNVGLTATAKRTHLLQPETPAVTATLAVDSSGACTFVFSAASKTLLIELTDPLGTVYSSAPSLPMPGFTLSVVPPLDDLASTGANYLFAFDAPAVGTWSYTITETMPPAHPRAVVVAFHSQSAVRIGLVGGGLAYRVDREVRIGLMVSDGAELLGAPTIEASLHRVDDPDYFPPPIVFRDDGVEGDGLAGDGLFTAAFEPGLTGEYSLRVVVIGASREGAAFERAATARFRVEPVRATLAAAKGESGIDSDGDGLLDFVRIEPTILVQQAGPYNVSATLQASNGHQIAANALLDLSAGTHAAQIDFPATGIREFLAVDGPYEVRNVRVESMAKGAGGTADVVSSLGPTEAYALSEFERPEILILGPSTVTTPDPDGDGLIDAVKVAVPLDLLFKGTYSWSARLVAANGVQVALAAGTGNLPAGGATASLSFSGATIGQAGLYGPFTVRNLIIFGGGKSAVADEVVSTAALSPCSFESGSQLADIDGDGVVDGEDLALLIAAWGSGDASADLDGDGTVDSIDLGVLLASWGSCP